MCELKTIKDFRKGCCVHALFAYIKFYSILLLFRRSIKSYRLEDYYCCCCYYYYYGNLGSQKLILKISWAKRIFACMARWLWTGIACWYFQDCCKMCLSRQHSDCTKWVLFLFFLLFGVFVALLQCSVQSVFSEFSSAPPNIRELVQLLLFSKKSLSFNECFCTRGLLALGAEQQE